MTMTIRCTNLDCREVIGRYHEATWDDPPESEFYHENAVFIEPKSGDVYCDRTCYDDAHPAEETEEEAA